MWRKLSGCMVEWFTTPIHGSYLCNCINYSHYQLLEKRVGHVLLRRGRLQVVIGQCTV